MYRNVAIFTLSNEDGSKREIARLELKVGKTISEVSSLNLTMTGKQNAALQAIYDNFKWFYDRSLLDLNYKVEQFD